MSDMLHFDISGVKEAPGSRLYDEGDYLVRIESVIPGTSKKAGTPQLEIQAVSIEEKPVQQNGSVALGFKFFYTLYFKPGTNAEISKRELHKLFDNTDTEWPTDEEGQRRLPLADLIGKTVIFVVKHEANQDKTGTVHRVTGTKRAE